MWSSMTILDPATLRYTIQGNPKFEADRGKTYVLAQPGVVTTFYLDGDWIPACAAIADAIEIYFTVVPRTEMRNYWANDGTTRTVGPRVISGDLRRLRNLPDHYEGYVLRYDSAPWYGVGDNFVEVRVLGPGVDWPQAVHLLRFGFPFNALDLYGQNEFLLLIERIAEVLPIHCGHVGYGFARVFQESDGFVYPLLQRYLGFDACDVHTYANVLAGHTYRAQWLTILSASLFTRLGGPSRLEEMAPQARLWSSASQSFIMSSRLPAVGDVTRGATDLGALPGVARFMRPLRVSPSGQHDYDVPAWLASLDDLADSDWDNAPAQS